MLSAAAVRGPRVGELRPLALHIDTPGGRRYRVHLEAHLKLSINGETQDVPEGITILGLLEFLKVRGERVAVEVNTEVVRRAQHAEHALREGDAVEIVTFVGGG